VAHSTMLTTSISDLETAAHQVVNEVLCEAGRVFLDVQHHARPELEAHGQGLLPDLQQPRAGRVPRQALVLCQAWVHSGTCSQGPKCAGLVPSGSRSHGR